MVMLILAATPIGNLADASPRLRQVLTDATLIAAEDTRTTRQLLQLLQLETRAKLVALHDHNEQAKALELAELAAHNDVVVVSDAGMPTISDPGFKLVAQAVLLNVPITVVPGPSAALTALALSGLPTDRFAFEGFLARKDGQLRSQLQALQHDPRTLIFFESPHRIARSCAVLAEIFGPQRRAAICRELTKLHEEVLRGTLEHLAAQLADRQLKGEIVLVVAGAASPTLSREQATQQAVQLVASGVRLKDAAREVAAQSQFSARELYALLLAQQK